MSAHINRQLRIRWDITEKLQHHVEMTIQRHYTQKQYIDEIERIKQACGYDKLTLVNRAFCDGFEYALSPLRRYHKHFRIKYFVDGEWSSSENWDAYTHIRVAQNRATPKAFFWKGTNNIWSEAD